MKDLELNLGDIEKILKYKSLSKTTDGSDLIFTYKHPRTVFPSKLDISDLIETYKTLDVPRTTSFIPENNPNYVNALRKSINYVNLRNIKDKEESDT